MFIMSQLWDNRNPSPGMDVHGTKVKVTDQQIDSV